MIGSRFVLRKINRRISSLTLFLMAFQSRLPAQRLSSSACRATSLASLIRSSFSRT